MDVTLQVSEFLQELEFLEKTSSKKPTIPVLGNVLLQADEAGTIRLAATDLEIGLVTSCAGAVDMAGNTTLPAKHLLDIVRLVPDARIRLTLDSNGSARVTSGSYTSRLQTYPADDFPKLPSMKGLPTVTLPQAALRSMIGKVAFAVSDKDKRYFMDGGLLGFGDGFFTLVATDGARLALSATTWGVTPAEPVIVPSGTLTKLTELLTGGEDILFAQSDRHLFFVINGRLLISRLANGKFPAYERIIPRGDGGVTVTLPCGPLRNGLKRALITSGDSALVVMQLRDGVLALSSKSMEIGEAAEELRLDYSGSVVQFAFNGKFLLDFLGATASETVELSQKTPTGAMLLTDGPQYSYVLVPARL